MSYWEEFKRCYQSKNDRPKTVAILGDSHAEHLFIGLAEELGDVNVVYYSKEGLPFLSNSKFGGVFLDLLQDKNIKIVLISAKWGGELRKLSIEQKKIEFDRLINILLSANKKVYIVDDVPEFRFLPNKCKYAGRLGQENICRQDAVSIKKERDSYYPLFTYLADKFPDVEIINTHGFFCGDADCLMANDGVLYYRDNHHLNVDGSKAVWRYIMQNSRVAKDIKIQVE